MKMIKEPKKETSTSEFIMLKFTNRSGARKDVYSFPISKLKPFSEAVQEVSKNLNGKNIADMDIATPAGQVLTDSELRMNVGEITEMYGQDFEIMFVSVFSTSASVELARQQRAKDRSFLLTPQQKTEQTRMDKLRKLVQVSKKLKISQMAKILEMSEDDLYPRIVDWAAEYGFTIDEDVVEFTSGRKEDFIKSLNDAFTNWGNKVETKEGKLE